MRIILVIWFGLFCHGLFGQNSFSFYVPPFIEIKTDTSFWEIPYETPCYLYANSPFDFKSNFALNSRDGQYRLKVFCHYDSSRIDQISQTMRDVYGFVALDSLSNPNWLAFSDKNDELTLLEVSTDFAYIVIQTNINWKLQDKTEWLFGWLNHVNRVDPTEIDRVAGYPFHDNQYLGTNRSERAQDLRKWLKKGTFSQMNKLYQDPLDTAFFDFFFMRDKLMNYSFTRYHQAQMRDKSRSYSRDENLGFVLHPNGDEDLVFLKEFAGESNVLRTQYVKRELASQLAPEMDRSQLDLMKSPLPGANPYLFVYNQKRWKIFTVQFTDGEWKVQHAEGEVNQSGYTPQRSLLGVKNDVGFETGWLDEFGDVLFVKARLNGANANSVQTIMRSRVIIVKNQNTIEVFNFDLPIPKKADYIFEERNRTSRSTSSTLGVMAYRDFIETDSAYYHFNLLKETDNGEWRFSEIPIDADWQKNAAWLYPISFSDLDGDGKNEIWSAVSWAGHVRSCVVYEWKNGTYSLGESKKWIKLIPGRNELEQERELERELEREQEQEVSTLPYYNQGMEALIAQIKENLKVRGTSSYGKVFLSLRIDAFGRLTEVIVEDNQTGNPELSDDIIRATQILEGFVPATLEGRNIVAELKVVVPIF